MLYIYFKTYCESLIRLLQISGRAASWVVLRCSSLYILQDVQRVHVIAKSLLNLKGCIEYFRLQTNAIPNICKRLGVYYKGFNMETSPCCESGLGLSITLVFCAFGTWCWFKLIFNCTGLYYFHSKELLISRSKNVSCISRFKHNIF